MQPAAEPPTAQYKKRKPAQNKSLIPSNKLSCMTQELKLVYQTSMSRRPHFDMTS